VGRKSRDIPTKISFKTERVHTVLFNPEAETEERKGDHGEYEVMPVQENGAPAYLPYSSSRLIKAINALNLKGPTSLRITREGEGMDASYKVENLGSNPQPTSNT